MVDLLAAALDRSRALGFLGPGPVSAQIVHARAFAEAWHQHRGATPRAVLDLGAGGGVPGLVLAVAWPEARVVLLDSALRRCEFLTGAVDQLGLAARVEVSLGRAETAARSTSLEGAFDLVTARSFGPPGTTAECAVRFLAPDGLLVVSEPPDEALTAARWPAEGLARLGLGDPVPTEESPRLVVIARVGECPAEYPRRDGVPAKRPLF